MSVRRIFVPWYRRGFAAALTRTDGGAARAELPATFRLGGLAETADLPIALAGPGDVVGLDPHEIRRCEPYDGCPNVEPGYFPYVELASPDLPWRFTPLGAADLPLADPEHAGASATGTRLAPWLALVVVPVDAASLSPASPGGLPVLETVGEHLPPPGESWAWAHVQVTLIDPQDVDAELADAIGDPSRTVARLLCPRRLAGATRYGGYLVPAFAAGKAVLDPAAVGPDALAPAWPATGPVRLPVYFSWSFSTSEDGTFERLARRLRPRAAPAEAAGRLIDTSRPGWAAAAQAGRTTTMQGAFRPLGTAEPAPDPALAASLQAAVSSIGPDIELRPPIYGQDYRDGVTAVAGEIGWLAELNRDPRRRLAAGLAAWAVTVLQEDLANQAWQQLAGAGRPAPEARASRELAAVVSRTLDTTHAAATAVAPTALRSARFGGPIQSAGPARRLRPSAALRRDRLTSITPIARTPAAAGPADRAQAEPADSFAPTFYQPAYELLRAVAPEWLLPGAEGIPLDSVVVLASHGAFAEAFLVGLNHALAQELLWRGYPLDREATLFGSFWGDEGTAIADWPPESALGSNGHGPDALVLLLRGSFVARFPTALIYLTRTLADGRERRVPPDLSGRIGGDATFLRFGLTVDQAAAPIIDGGGPWRVVLQEAVDHARFGADDPDGPAALGSWMDLDWGHPQLAGHTHVPVAGLLLGLTRPVGPGSVDTATWGLSAGHLASALQQPAFAIRIPLSLWLTPEPEA
jgi:hypothetical protein